MKSATLLLIAVLAACAVAPPAGAQPVGGGGPAGSFGGGAGGRGADKQGDLKAAPGLPDIRPLPEPSQRLEPGALLCPTQAALRQHQAAIRARLSGGFAPEPVGCRLVRDRVAVGVLSRDGLAATQVSIPGDPPQTGWTDSPVKAK